jgi:iron(III) transport system permease protein
MVHLIPGDVDGPSFVLNVIMFIPLGVLLPLLRPSLVGAWVYIFIISLRELGSSILLYSSESVVLAVRIFDLRDSGNYTTIAALSVFLIVLLVVLVSILQRLGGRTGREA